MSLLQIPCIWEEVGVDFESASISGDDGTSSPPDVARESFGLSAGGGELAGESDGDESAGDTAGDSVGSRRPPPLAPFFSTSFSVDSS